jgi:ATP-binding cassette subfamily B (MDR/TAP) protein 1
MAYEVIDKVPSVDPNIKGDDPTNLKGKLEFKNVKFVYPSRPDL